MPLDQKHLPPQPSADSGPDRTSGRDAVDRDAVDRDAVDGAPDGATALTDGGDPSPAAPAPAWDVRQAGPGRTATWPRTGPGSTSPSWARGRWCCWSTAGPSTGGRGATS
ncbi:hypothetical protein ACFQ0M_23375 [Kitasatospora aburaviensis]